MLPIVKYIIRQYKHCADNRHIPWQLSDEEAVQLMACECKYCGAKNSNRAYRKQYTVKLFFYNGIDRVDSNLPYRLDNCVSCCGECNAAKSNATVADFLNSAWLVARRLNILRNL